MKRDDEESMNIKRTYIGRYKYNGGLGANWTSREKGVTVGEVRVINKVLHHAFMVYKKGWFGLALPEISWARVDNKWGMDLEGGK